MPYEAALKYRARSTLLVWNSGVTRLIPSLTSASTLNRPAASGAVPYVVSRLSWLARSSLSLGTRFGYGRGGGRVPELAGHPGQELGHVDPGQVREQGDGQEQQAADHVADDHRHPAVQPVRQRPGQRPEQQRGQQRGQPHPADGRALGRQAAGGKRRRQHGERDDAQPVTEAGQRQRDPQPPERLDGKNAWLTGMMAPGGAVPELPPAGAVLSWCGAEVHGVRVSALLAA